MCTGTIDGDRRVSFTRVAIYLTWIAVTAVTSTVRAADDSWGWVTPFIKAANSWHRGETIPPRLQHYQHSQSDLPDPTDTRNLISEVTNLDLLAARW